MIICEARNTGNILEFRVRKDLLFWISPLAKVFLIVAMTSLVCVEDVQFSLFGFRSSACQLFFTSSQTIMLEKKGIRSICFLAFLK